MPRANWKGETREDYNGRALARKLVVLDACEFCGKRATDRHHRDGNPRNNALSNIVQVCRRCHMVVDGRLKSIRTLPRYVTPLRACDSCAVETKPTWKGMCRRCYDAKRRAPCAAHAEAKVTR